MDTKWLGLAIGLLIASACSLTASETKLNPATPPADQGGDSAVFETFSYSGFDEEFAPRKNENEFFNPILSGFYPDPSIVRSGDDFYLVHSTFGYFPGVPIFHSTDLINWTQIGNVIDRPDMLDYANVNLAWNGIYAPTIEYHDGVFHVITTCAGCGGNFVVTSSDPAGPWSDPIWLPDVGGIDPSLHFENGRVWILNHDLPDGGATYTGHRAIWIREVDPITFQSIEPATMIVNGGSDLENKPWYVEAPHLYKIDDEYLLSAAEGGTEEGHSQVLFKSNNILGPYIPYSDNPVLTQRDLPADRANPINSAGHADFVELENGEWWAVFLATRPHTDIHFNTGRETFLLPVTWRDGWPIILERGTAIPYKLERPALQFATEPKQPNTGNFDWKAKFEKQLDPSWLFIRTPQSKWWKAEDGRLVLSARPDRIGQIEHQPSFVGQRQKNANYDVSTVVRFNPASTHDEAGLAIMQSDRNYITLGVSKNEDGETVLRVRQRAGGNFPNGGTVLIESRLDVAINQSVFLRAQGRGPTIDFAYSLDGENYTALIEGVDAIVLSPRYTENTSGGFVGNVIGMYAQGEKGAF